MRKAAADVPNMRPVSRTVSVPAPVGGWNAQDALADMPIEDAVILDNYIPRPGYVEMRKGSFLQASGVGTAVLTLMVWSGVTDKLLAAAEGKIYDVSNQGVAGPSPIYSAATSAAWDWVRFANAAGTWVIAVNGADTPVKFDGTTVTTTAFTYAGTPPPSFDPTKLSLITAHKRRLHMVEKNSLRVWFMTNVDAIAGPVGLLDLGPVFSKGGYLVAAGTTSLDYGLGLDDFAVYVTNQGQIAMYQGTDPGNASVWSLVGVYNVGYPLGQRSLLKIGSDLAIMTTDGVIPLSQAIKLDRTQDNAVALTQKIQNAFQLAGASYPPGTFGWQAMLYPKGSLAIVNVPSTPAVQFVQNVQIGRWCRFTGLNASCWAVANNNAYFASGSNVYQWDIGADDAGVQIIYDLKGAFSNFKRPGQKRFSMIRPLMNTVSWIKPALGIDVNFGDVVPTAIPLTVDVAELTPQARYDWTGVSGIGFVGAPRMRIQIQNVPQTAIAIDAGDVDELVTGDGYSVITQDAVPVLPFQLTGFDLVFEEGGIL
jgi:hypothetical protein